ncbi:hypothetical protein COCCADRAFT_81618 [Bipolaris zeicola 26-R-13]|uniref:Uncharacterized protein n=1 Tax=Cochliobolus carbonum (strain 26-R-13) TaxID=930089 RepID=W6YHX8_COCC2|nr:uncharacterized protein COCCADRAFT_81618 [Bipolaris zeicola 26-R-13]EUC38917.1 hypothetical protein COCCADRAFT_81618 [Bipolaris zeicola 26-R-13]
MPSCDSSAACDSYFPPFGGSRALFFRGLRRTLLKSGVLVGHRQVISNPFIQHTDGSP